LGGVRLSTSSFLFYFKFVLSIFLLVVIGAFIMAALETMLDNSKMCAIIDAASLYFLFSFMFKIPVSCCEERFPSEIWIFDILKKYFRSNVTVVF
jgi:hypothetical protein